MKKEKKSMHKICLLLAVVLTLLLPVWGGNALAEELVSAPINPEFLSYMEGLQKDRVMAGASHEGDGLGLIPSPLNLDHLTGVDIFGAPQVKELAEAPLRLGFPASYDLRTQGKLTPVRDQNPGNTCWTFATYGSLESNLLPGETNDFSENHMKNTHGFDWGYNSGGNGDMATAYLARWGGPVNETDDPYDPNSGVSPSGLSPRKHVQGVIYIPARSSASDNDNLKNAVMSAGAVYTTMYISQDASYYNEGTYAFYYNGVSGSNHAVAIVGWDDNYSSANFSSAPPGNGAFIVRNSWGTGFGDGGYFYISYYDTKLAYSMNYLFYNAESTTNYSRIYQYDPLGWLSQIGYSNDTGWFANIFTAEESERLAAVSFYCPSVNCTYDVYIYNGVTAGVPRSGTLAVTETGTIQYPGYTTINLSSPVSLESGEKFSIVVRLTAPGASTPIAIESRIPGYSSSATASAGQSFIGSSGSSWSDLTTLLGHENDNVCLKGLTGGSTLYATFTGYGLYKHDGSSWVQLNGTVPTNMVASGNTVYATFTGYGLYKHDGTSWTQLNGTIPTNMVASGNTVYATFTGYGLYKHDGTSWTQLNGTIPESMAASGSTVYATFTGYGLYKHDGSSWTQLNGTIPTSMVASGTILYATFTGYGLYKHDGSSWIQLNGTIPTSMVASGNTLYATFTGYGLYKHDGSSWVQLNGTVPTNMVASGNTVYATFTGYGLYKHDGSDWVLLSGTMPASMVASDPALFATFTGYGLYKHDGTSWTQLNGTIPEGMVVGE